MLKILKNMQFVKILKLVKVEILEKMGWIKKKKGQRIQIR